MIDNFANRLKKLRREAGISQEQLAIQMDVSRSAVAAWETGKRVPPLSTIRSIAYYFNVSSDYLCGGVHRKGITVTPDSEIDLTRLNADGVSALAEYYRVIVKDEKYAAQTV